MTCFTRPRTLVRVFHNDASRLGERLNTFDGGVRIGNIVIAQRLSLMQSRRTDPRLSNLTVHVERRVLMGVFAVAHY